MTKMQKNKNKTDYFYILILLKWLFRNMWFYTAGAVIVKKDFVLLIYNLQFVNMCQLYSTTVLCSL